MKLNLEIGQKLSVHSYKHDGLLYRKWDKAQVLENNQNYLALVNEHVTVTEANGQQWDTYDPAIWLFFPDEWYNIICMIRPDGIHYYCNIASPFIHNKEVIKYIDYDLDIKVFPNRSYRLLDLKEFQENGRNFQYSRLLKKVIWKKFNFVKKKIQKTPLIFDDQLTKELWQKFLNQKK